MVHSSNGLLYVTAIKNNEVELHELILKRCQWLLNDRNRNKNSIYMFSFLKNIKYIYMNMHVSPVQVCYLWRGLQAFLEGAVKRVGIRKPFVYYFIYFLKVLGSWVYTFYLLKNILKILDEVLWPHNGLSLLWIYRVLVYVLEETIPHFQNCILLILHKRPSVFRTYSLKLYASVFISNYRCRFTRHLF